MNLSISYGNPTKIYSDAPPNDILWNRIISIFSSNQADIQISSGVITLDWATILMSHTEFSSFLFQHKIHITLDDASKFHLTQHAKSTQIIHQAGGKSIADFSISETSLLLEKKGFTKRTLLPHQISIVHKLASIPHGANFSVPGAGKTTVTLSIHLLTREADTKLLVVSPKNAFSAWDDVIGDCLNESIHSDWNFIRLEGGKKKISELLQVKNSCFIISYDQLRNSQSLIYQFLSSNKVHMVLDESHKMKAGNDSKTGKVLLQLAHIPVRKDILTGTPIPRSINDLEAQIEFLWPAQKVFKNKIASSPELKSLYARTTKNELSIPSVDKYIIPVNMSKAQLALYAISRKEFLKRASGIPASTSIQFSKVKNSVMQLLQLSSNPIMYVNKITGNSPETYVYDNEATQSLFLSISKEKDSLKMIKACDLAVEILAANQDEKVIIWSTFTYNVERLAFLLKDFGAVFIHGGIGTGDILDKSTREGRIHTFKTDPNCRVIVANPAACSEGISLHMVCHNAIYLDRSYNAGQYLQSLDRIHRLGLPENTKTSIYILQTLAPENLGSIDKSVQLRTLDKLRIMDSILDDEDIQQLILDESEELEDDPYIDENDIKNLFEELS
ncbi:SNF2-related protein [Listeria newyorkensis]|uniref:DEAD/DEAH box helicase n=1 Tax=Listeria newyorkensis TaxID=1497681 RepID=A0A841YX49_9LIST|nr:DEAD/DEAH box helicase [Listeria newyorkensis]MBC1457895.1 DEAD/DEAH box helicase [Listeria newyorkensis]